VSRVLILNMDVMAGLAGMPEESYHMIVTSVPYWGLRDYDIPPSVWGADSYHGCDHQWGRAGKRHRGGPQGKTGDRADRDNTPKNATGDVRTGAFCRNCGAWRGCLGMEPTIQLYVEHIVAVFRELRRVLRRDGTCWLNIGDSYYGTPNGNHGYGTSGLTNSGQYQERKPLPRIGRSRNKGNQAADVPAAPHRSPSPGLKPKDMCLVPSRVIIALQDNGWFVRRDIIWQKEAGMPESATDRPTTAHEYVWLLSKRARYFYDWLAIAEPTSPDTHARMGRAHNTYQAPGQDEQRGVAGFRENTNNGVGPKSRIPSGWDTSDGHHHGKRGRYSPRQNPSFQAATNRDVLAVRNSRSVWTINPEPFGLEMCQRCRVIYETPEYRKLPKVDLPDGGHTRRCRCRSLKWISHFATFPTKLAERCIRAGTSEKGVCPSCFAPWARIVQKGLTLDAWKKSCGADLAGEYHGASTKGHDAAGVQDASAVKARILSGMRERVTVGWRQTCNCAPHEPVLNVTVLDPFGGSGRTAVVADQLQRHATLIEINGYYCEMARWLIGRDAPLLADVEIRKGVSTNGKETQEAETEAGARAGAGVLSVEQEARG